MAKRVEQTKTFNFSITETFEDGRVETKKFHTKAGGRIETKKFHTKAGIRKLYDLSDMTIHRMLFIKDYIPRKHKNIKIIKIKEAARTITQL